MNLYLVYCAYLNVLKQTEIYPVYVVANNPHDASNYAMEAVKTLGYKYTQFVERIDLVASASSFKAKHLLVFPILENVATIN